MMGVLDKMRGATRARRTHTLCLDAGLQAEHDELAGRLENAAEQDAREASLAEPAKNLTKLVNRMEEIRDRMQDSLVTFTIEAPEWTERLALQAKHPPRENQMLDQLRGYNIETFLPALIKASTVSVEDTSGDKETDVPDDAWDGLFKALNFGGVNKLAGYALEVNDTDAEVPRSARSLLESQDSGASLAQPSPGKPRRNGSAGGSRRSSRSSSTAKKAPAKKAASSG